MRVISNLVLLLALVGGLALSGLEVWQWGAIAAMDNSREAMQATFLRSFGAVSALLAILILGYLFSFPARTARPTLLLGFACFGVGAAAGIVGREAMSVYEFTADEVPSLDALACATFLGGGSIFAMGVLAFEAVNRFVWLGLAVSADRSGNAGLALFFSRIGLLFHPGHQTTLRSVTLTRFRRGDRDEEIGQVLRGFYEAGDRSAELLEALAKLAREAGDTKQLIHHLKELRALFPDDADLRELLIHELLEQGANKEALDLLEQQSVPMEEESLERYALVLLAEGKLDKAAAVARELGELEGIPFRRSQRVLRELLQRASESVPALNTLAAQAERMANKEQRLRWLEKSLEADPRQVDVRMALIGLYRDAGNSQRLEQLLEESVRHSLRSDEIAVEYASVLVQNEKYPEALRQLGSLNARVDSPLAGHLLEIRIRLNEGDYDGARQVIERVARKEGNAQQLRELEALRRELERAILTNEVASAVESARQHPDDAEIQLTALHKLLDGRHTDRVLPFVDDLISRAPALRDEVIAILSARSQTPEFPFSLMNLLTDLLVSRARFDDALTVVQMMTHRGIDPVSTARDGAQKILRRSPHHLPTLRFLGDINRQNGRFTEMIHSYALYLAQGGEETESIDEALADAYISLGDFENARRFVNQLLRSRGDSFELLQRMTALAVEAERAEEAADYLKRMEVLAPRDPETKRLKEKVNVGLGERRLAFLKKELDAGRNDGPLLEQLGDLAHGMANYSEAITYYQRATRMREDANLVRRATAKLSLSYTRKRLDDLASETLRDLSISLEDDPKELATLMGILYEIADLFLEMKLYAKSEKIFKQLCKIDAGYRDVLQKVESLRA